MITAAHTRVARATWVASVLALALGAACHDVIDPRDEDRLIELAAADTATADGATIMPITATVERDLPLDQRGVTFTTTAGQFLVAGKAEPSATIAADAAGIAVVLLRAPSEATVARITATAAGSVRSRDVRFLARVERFLRLTAPDSGVADGRTAVEIVAELDPATPEPQRTVTFTTTAGTFDPPGTSETAMTARTGADGRVVVRLRAPSDSARALVTVTAAGMTRTRTIQFRKPPTPPPERLIDLIVPQSAPLADAATLSEVTAVLAADTPPTQRAVTFTTAVGQFVAAAGGGASVTVTAGADGRATAQLRSPADTAEGVVTATAGTSIRSRSLTFQRALPQSLQLVPQSFSLKAGVANEMTFTVRLRRAFGAPSPGVDVDFTATDTTAERRPRGRFSTAAPSDATGAVTVRYTSADSTFTGPVLVRAVARPQPLARDSVVIVIVR